MSETLALLKLYLAALGPYQVAYKSGDMETMLRNDEIRRANIRIHQIETNATFGKQYTRQPIDATHP